MHSVQSSPPFAARVAGRVSTPHDRRQTAALIRSLRQAVQSRDIIVREAHHRVKNTLQVAASLLALRDDTIVGEARGVLRRARDQLFVLANLHGLLARRGGRADEVHAPDLLQAVGNALRRSFPEASARVTLRIDAEDITLPAGEAITLALVANELITNAYRHAFPGSRSGEIEVSFQHASPHEALLRVQDDGVGMPFSGRSEGLGLELLRALAGQLNAQLLIADTRAGGRTCIELRIPRKAAARRPL